MAAEIGDPTEDTGKGAGGTVPGITRRYRTTGAAQDEMTEDAVTLVGDRTGITAEADLSEKVMVTTPPLPPPPRWAE